MLHDEEEEEDLLPFEGIDKAAVLHDCREFSAVTVNVSACTATLTKVMFLLAAGQTFSANEATEVFFAATKLFQCENPKLRRLLFVALKELSTVAEQVFIASSSLVKDISGNNDVYRTNAIRTLRKVTDSTMIGPMERFLKQACVDKNNNVVSAAIVTGIHLSHTQPEMVKRWGTEVNEALKTRGNRVQYHALALLHKLRKNDRLSVLKLVQQAQSGPIRSPLALCLLIRMCTEFMQEDFANSLELYKFVTNMTHHSSDVVVFEAAKSICSLTNITAKEASPAVLVLQLYLSSHKPVLRFAAVRLLNRVATNHPSAVTACNLDLETLIADSNRNIATLAITTLLKTGSEFNMERLMRTVASFLRDINDEFKTVVIDSMRIISIKFPQKYQTLLTFLSTALHEDGGAEFKQSIVETIVSILETNPQAKDACLQTLAEYIEDCDYNALTQRVLYLLGQHGPLTPNPAKFVRFIYNRVALEAPAVRAVAIATLAKFGASVPELRPRITVLMKRTIADDDDEVRDRAAFYHKLFASNDEVAIQNLVTNVTDHVAKERTALQVSRPKLTVADTAAPPVASTAEEAAEQAAKMAETAQSAAVAQMRERLRKIPQIREFGEPLKTCEPVPLTEPDSEYVVSVAKHIYANHTVFQFKVTNTIDDKVFTKVQVKSDCSELENAAPIFAIPIDKVGPGETEYSYFVVRHDPEGSFPLGSVSNSFAFALADVGDEENADDSDEYPLDEFAVNLSDFIIPTSVGDFEKQWTAFKDEETSGTYSLASMKNLTHAAGEVIDFFGMKVDGDRPEKITTKSYTINMSGCMANAEKTVVLISAKVFIASDNTVALTLTLRGGDEELRQYLTDCLMS